jgi:hypothetical protein
MITLASIIAPHTLTFFCNNLGSIMFALLGNSVSPIGRRLDALMEKSDLDRYRNRGDKNSEYVNAGIVADVQ